jgi:hypothetical protein
MAVDVRLMLGLLATCCCGATTPRDQAAAIDRLREVRGKATWDKAAVLRGDFDCDGISDAAALGREAGNVLVGVVRGSGGPPEVLQFAVDESRQDAICGEPANLDLDSIAEDPSEDAGGPLEGFRTSQSCKGLRLSGGECDDVFLYWNHATKHLDWWRP